MLTFLRLRALSLSAAEPVNVYLLRLRALSLSAAEPGGTHAVTMKLCVDQPVAHIPDQAC